MYVAIGGSRPSDGPTSRRPTMPTPSSRSTWRPVTRPTSPGSATTSARTTPIPTTSTVTSAGSPSGPTDWSMSRTPAATSSTPSTRTAVICRSWPSSTACRRRTARPTRPARNDPDGRSGPDRARRRPGWRRLRQPADRRDPLGHPRLGPGSPRRHGGQRHRGRLWAEPRGRRRRRPGRDALRDRALDQLLRHPAGGRDGRADRGTTAPRSGSCPTCPCPTASPSARTAVSMSRSWPAPSPAPIRPAWS